MTYKERRDSLDWALQQVSNLKGKLDQATSMKDRAESLIVAIRTAFAISGGDDAKAGKLIREHLERHKDDRR